MPTYYVWEEGVGWVTSSAAGLGSPLTTKGDLYGFSSTNARVPVGTDGQVLTADSAQTLGVKWATNAAAGVSSLDSITGAVSLVAGSNVTITDNSPSAGDITIAASGGGGGLVKLFDSTLGSAAASIDTGANGIAAGHVDLLVLHSVRSAAAAASDALVLQFNGDTGSHYYSFRCSVLLSGGVASFQPVESLGTGFGRVGVIPAANAPSNTFSNGSITVVGYDRTTVNQVWTEHDFTMQALTTSNLLWSMTGGNWRPTATAAINQLKVFTGTGSNLAAGSRLVVYGMQ